MSTPSAITASWIESEPEPYAGVEAFFLERWQPSTEEALFKQLPSGYRAICRFAVLYADVENGGFWQFLVNALSVDRSGRLIVETFDALNRFGLSDLTGLLTNAVAVMGSRLPPDARSVLADDDRKAAANRHPSDDDVERDTQPLDDKFNAMNCSWFPQIDAYIKAHPDEFIHG